MADRMNLAKEFGRTVAEMEDRLELHPAIWGDSLRHYIHLNQMDYRRIYNALQIDYTVHGEKPYVWIVDFWPFLDHPPAQGN